MRNLKFIIEYDGTDFHGWQVQSKCRTVQGDVESALQQLLQEDVRIISASRTDQGVHASGQVANAKILSAMDCARIKFGLNALTQDDIYISSVEETDEDFHSRFSARSKIYHYYIMFDPSPCRLRYNWYVPYSLNMKVMHNALPRFSGEKDFRYFSVRNGKDNTVCTLSSLTLTEHKGQLIIVLQGDRFLRKMIRGIVGFLHDVGRDRFTPEQADDAFNGDLADLYFAPPQGLFLMEVKY